MKRSPSLLAWALLTSLAIISTAAAAKIPAILDTDIGDDIDYTWALTLALQSPELDLKLVVGDYGKPLYRARLLAKLLENAQRTDIAVGLGIEFEADQKMRQAQWIEGYNLDRYPGQVHRDGIQAIIDVIMKSPEPVALICIGPVPNIAEALQREPRIAEKARFIGMHGSVRVGYGGSKTPSAEWNVKAAAPACQKALSAPWNITITPLDTCGLVRLTGAKYAAVRESTTPRARGLMENYRAWCDWNNAHNERGHDAAVASSTLFDCVAIYLAFTSDLCVMERLKIRVTGDGFTRESAEGIPMNVATSWKSLSGFEDWLVRRLTDKSANESQP